MQFSCCIKNLVVVLLVAFFSCVAVNHGTALGQADESQTPQAVDPSATDAEQFEVLLTDGSRLRGKLDVGEIRVTTKYGELTVPLIEVTRLKPGLKTRKSTQQHLEKLLTMLGSDDFNDRDKASAELLRMGPAVGSVLQQLANSDNAEQTARLKTILDHFADLRKTWGKSSVEPLHRLDSVSTREFSVLGHVQTSDVKVRGVFGEITVPLASVRTIRKAQPFFDGEIFQDLAVKATSLVNAAGLNVVESQPQSSGIKIQRGDLVSIRADGTVTRTTTGSSSCKPDGSSNWGTVQSSPRIYGGTLMVRVGTDGEFMPAGSRHSFTADSNGVLQLGLAASSTSYKYVHDGVYDVKIKIARGQ